MEVIFAAKTRGDELIRVIETRGRYLLELSCELISEYPEKKTALRQAKKTILESWFPEVEEAKIFKFLKSPVIISYDKKQGFQKDPYDLSTVEHWRARCPRCGGERIEIFYGIPEPKVWRKVEQKEMVLGGCFMVDPFTKKWECKDCGYRWGAISLQECEEKN